MNLPSASYLPRVVPCPASHALPQEPEEKGAAAHRGTAIHAYLAAVSKVGRDAALEQVPAEYLEECEAIPVERLPTNLAAEVTFALDLGAGTARELGRDLGRDYSGALSHELVGTADLVGIADDCVTVLDYKSGWSRQPPAGEHWQLLALAVAGARAYGVSNARVGIITLHDGRSHYDMADLDALDLDAALDGLRAMAGRIDSARADVAAGRQPQTHPGAWCRYCPAWKSCPSQTALLRQVVAAPEAVERDVLALLTPETARLAYERIKQVSDVVRRVEQAVYAWAARTPIDLGDGTVLGPTQTQRESIDAEKALRVLEARLGPHINIAVERSTSKAAIKRAITALAKESGGKVAPLEREILEALRSAGAVEMKTTETIKEHKA